MVWGGKDFPSHKPQEHLTSETKQQHSETKQQHSELVYIRTVCDIVRTILTLVLPMQRSHTSAGYITTTERETRPPPRSGI